LKTGVIGAMGTTERGSTVADFDPLEKTYGHSLNYLDRQLPLPRHPRPPGRHARHAGLRRAVDRALAGVDLAVIVINAQNGIELNTTRMMRAAASAGSTA
jgi:elongation factor G